MDAEEFHRANLPSGTLTLLCIRKAGSSSSLDNLIQDCSAIQIEAWPDHTLFWFASAHQALIFGYSAVTSDPDRLSAGVSTGDTIAEPQIQRIVAEAVGAADLTEPGQILVALSTQELTRAELDSDLCFALLGSRELETGIKSLLFLLINPSKESERPRAGYSKRWNPREFVGRRSEIDHLVHAFEATRFVNVSGPTGVGKTTLAARVAAEFQDDALSIVVWVELEDVQRSSLVLHRIAAVLEISYRQEATLLEQIIKNIGERELFFVLDAIDNVQESILEVVETILESCPNVSFLTTSTRRRRSKSAESLVLNGLEFPSPHEPLRRILDYEATQLFVRLAQKSDPSFEITDSIVEEIAYILDSVEGSPWAILIATNSLHVLTPRQILARLRDDPFAFLVDRNLPKQTIHATLAAALSTLNPWALHLFKRLWVFQGSFDAAAVDEICTDEKLPSQAILDSLGALSDAHLTVPSQRGKSSRSFRLNQIVREYSASFATREDRRFLQARMTKYLQTKEERFWSSSLGTDSQALDEFDRAYEDLRKGWIERAKLAESSNEAVATIVRCANFWIQKLYFAEGLALVRQIANEAVAHNTVKFCSLLNVGAWCALNLADYPSAEMLLRAAFRVARERNSQEDQAKILNSACGLFSDTGRLRTSLRCARAALSIYEGLGDQAAQKIMKSNLAGILGQLNRLEEARLLLTESRSPEGQAPVWSDVSLLGNLADLDVKQSNWQQCRADLLSACDLAQTFPHMSILPSLHLTACAMCEGQGRLVDLSILVEATWKLIDHFGFTLSPKRQRLLDSFSSLAGRCQPSPKDSWSHQMPYTILYQILE
jgi:predicted ATPase